MKFTKDYKSMTSREVKEQIEELMNYKPHEVKNETYGFRY